MVTMFVLINNVLVIVLFTGSGDLLILISAISVTLFNLADQILQ